MNLPSDSIELENEGVALCDPLDKPLLSLHKWWKVVIHKRTYAMTRIAGKTVYMHSLVLPDAKEVDHKNRDGLDNRRENLRECTHSQNIAHAEFPPSKSGYRGVRHSPKGRPNRPWQARIKVGGRDASLGYFSTAEDAARAYDAAAVDAFGEFAYQNFPK